MEDRIIEICKSCKNAKVRAISLVREEYGISLVEAKKKVDGAFKLLDNSTPLKKSSKKTISNTAHENEIRYDLHLITGQEHINNSQYPTMWSTTDGYIYFEENKNQLYTLVDIAWNGPRYTTTTTSHTEGRDKGKVKRKGRFLGAVVGTIIAPGIGTAIGAAHGTGNKKSKKNIVSDTLSTEHQSEVPTPCSIKLKDIESNQCITLNLQCLSALANRLSLLIKEEKAEAIYNSSSINSDPYEEIKKAKELLDMGIITQDEFDIKKKQLLDL